MLKTSSPKRKWFLLRSGFEKYRSLDLLTKKYKLFSYFQFPFILRALILFVVMVLVILINMYSRPQGSTALRFLKERTTNYLLETSKNKGVDKNLSREARRMLKGNISDVCLIPRDVDPKYKCEYVKENCSDINTVGMGGYLNLRYCSFIESPIIFYSFIVTILSQTGSFLIVVIDNFLLPGLLFFADFIGLSEELAGITILALICGMYNNITLFIFQSFFLLYCCRRFRFLFSVKRYPDSHI
jgi:hypothetical protein